MIRLPLLFWVLVLALPAAVAQSESHSDTDVDVSALVRETQQQTREPGYFGLLWWTPVEYWEKSAERGGMSAEKAHERYASLRKYTVIMAAVGKLGIGNINWISEPEIRSNLRLRDAAGNDYAPVQELTGDAKGLASMLKPILANMLGTTGQNIEIYFFPAADKMAKPIADPLAPGSFSVVITNILGPKESIYVWKLPLTTLSPPRYCPVGKERMEASWKYCPWHGVKLDNKATNPTEAAKPETGKVDAAYQQSFNKWKAELIDDFKQDWLTLVGLYWLKPGTNTFGSNAGNSIVLPSGSAPARAGEFELRGKEVSVKVAPGVKATIGGKQESEAPLKPDTSGEPTVIELGSLRMHLIVRGERIGIRAKDLNSPAVKNYRGPTFFPLDLKYRITAAWVPSDGTKTVDVPDVLGDVRPTTIAGQAKFKINGQEVTLTELGGDPSKGLFFVFSDATKKTDTYPGGRFLQTDPVANGTVVLDFNRAYNPPCAVTPYATCPLAPKENRLAVAIPAGERYDRKEGSH